MRELVFASNNQHKTNEIQAKIKDFFKVLTLKDVGCLEEIVEDGETLDENASIKSQYVFKNYHKDAFGDDTGLEIEALNNEPGVYSARYSGERNDLKNLELVLAKMEGKTNRKARFRTVISLILNGEEIKFEGIVNGNIRTAIAGKKGFGYDPIFEPEGYQITFAEMTMDEKNAISHRGRATEKLLQYLAKI